MWEDEGGIMLLSCMYAAMQRSFGLSSYAGMISIASRNYTLVQLAVAGFPLQYLLFNEWEIVVVCKNTFLAWM